MIEIVIGTIVLVFAMLIAVDQYDRYGCVQCGKFNRFIMSSLYVSLIKKGKVECPFCCSHDTYRVSDEEKRAFWRTRIC